MSRPLPSECDAFYHHYIGLTRGEDPTVLPVTYGPSIASFFSSLSEEKAGYAYAPGKWTLQQVLQHLIDVERVFVFRLLWIIRGDSQALPGFDENAFANSAPARHRSLKELNQEWLLLRGSTDQFITQLSLQELARQGMANGSAISANALCFIIYGHVLHHMMIISERYAGH
ncbi:MAG: DinB family protein [Chitinophagia bacterium]|nr:DinB family protein [Chitinophagia bacterium]